MENQVEIDIANKPDNLNILDNSNDIVSSKKMKSVERYIIGVKKAIKLPKFSKISLGFEYDPEIKSDDQFCEKIMKSNLYAPSKEKLVDYYSDITRLLELTEFKDTRNVGTIIGMAILGVIGFLAFSFTIIGGIAGGIIGIALGRYAGKKITRRIKRKKPLTNEEIFKTKLECLIKWGEMQSKNLRHNLNEYRMILEKIIEEFTPALEIQIYQKPKSAKLILAKLKTFLMRAHSQKVMLLSYKLFKFHLKNSDLNDFSVQKEVADKTYNFFMTYKRLLEVESKKDLVTKKKVEFMVSYQKIVKLIESEFIKEILKNHQNAAQSNENIEKLKNILKQQVDVSKKIIDFAIENKQFLEITTDKSKFSINGDLAIIPDMININEHNNSLLDKNLKLVEINLDENLDIEENIDKQSVYITENRHNVKIPGPSIPKSRLSLVMEKVQKLSEDIIRRSFDKKPKDHSNESSDVSSLEDNEDDDEVIQDSCLYRPPDDYHYPKVDSAQVAGHKGEELGNEFDISMRKSPQKTKNNDRLNSESKSKNSEIMEDSKQVNEPENGNLMDNKGNKSSKMNMPISGADSASEKIVMFQKILEIDSDSYCKWDKALDNPLMKIQKVKPEDSPVVLIRGVATLEGFTPKEIYDVIYDSKYRAKWDTVVSNFRVVEKIDEFTDIIHFLIKAPIGIKDRDFLQNRCYQFDFPEKGHIIVSFKSTTHPSVPPVNGIIRGDTIRSGYIIRPHPKDPKRSTELVIISQVDIKGSIPKYLVNMAASKSPLEWVNKLIKAARQRPKNL